MSLESYFAELLTSCSNNIIYIKMPLSFVVFLIYDRDFFPVILGVAKTLPCDIWVFSCCGVWGWSLLSPGTESSFAQPINGNDLIKIQRNGEGEQGRRVHCLFLLKSWVGHLKRLSRSRVWTNKSNYLLSSEAVQRFVTGCCECNTQLYMDSVAVQWLLQGSQMQKT